MAGILHQDLLLLEGGDARLQGRLVEVGLQVGRICAIQQQQQSIDCVQA